MAKVTLDNLATTLANSAAAAINANNDDLELAFENTLSRDGTGPNQMLADIDLNNNDLLNANTINAELLVLNGRVVTPPDLVNLPDILMSKDVYDPRNISDDAFDPANHSGAFWDSGTTRTMRERGRDVYNILDAPGNADPTGANLSTTALQAMFTEANNGAGIELDLMYGNYKIDQGLYLNKPAKVIGRGRGYWHPKSPASNDGVSSAAATQLILVGTGAKDKTVHGVSSMRVSGGVVANPSSSTGNDTEYSLTSFVTPNSDGAAPRVRKPFSAGLWLGPGAAGSLLRGFRMVPNGGGANGLDKYVTTGLASDAWADNWDYGLVLEMANRIIVEDCEFVGHYRGAGELVLALMADPTLEVVSGRAALWGAMHSRSGFSGFRGIEVRGPDAFRVVTVGAGFIEVPWADDHPFDDTVYPFFAYGTGTFTAAGTKTFTAMSKVGANLRLTVDTTGISVGNHIFARRFFGGTSHCTWDYGCSINGMNHQSGNVCHATALGANIMPNPGAAFVASGWRMTELEVYGSIQSVEEVGIHVHSLAGSKIVPQLEGSGPKPLRIITSPAEVDSTRVTNPAGRTQSSFIDSARGLTNESNIDTRPVLDSATASAAYPSDSGFFQFVSTCEVPTMDFRKSDGGKSLYYDRTLARNIQAAHTYPIVDNTHDDGSAAFRKRSDFARNQFFGSGTAAVTGAPGTPVGSAGGNAGTVYVNETNGKVYAKPTGTGSTDWQELSQMLVGSVTWDPASLADGAGVSQNVTVTGAAFGDFCVPSFSLNTQGMILTAHVTAADTVTVRLQNETTGVIDLGSGTLRVAVLKL